MKPFQAPRFASPPGESSPEQRQACRYEASEYGALIGWWEGEEFRSSPVRLVNISQAGALVIAEACPPEGAAVGICLEEPSPTDWVEARLIDASGSDREGHSLRLAFVESCPYGFFKAAVASFPRWAEEQADEPVAEGDVDG